MILKPKELEKMLISKKKPLIIGVAGGSSSGKTTLCSLIQKRLVDKKAMIVSTDDFHVENIAKMISPLTNEEFIDWSHPKSINLYGLINKINQGISDKDTDFILVEGLPVLYFSQLRDLLDLKLYIDLEPEVRMYRRIIRNIQKYNISIEEVANYHLNSARFRENEYIIPTKIYADIILNGYCLDGIVLDLLCNYIKTAPAILENIAI